MTAASRQGWVLLLAGALLAFLALGAMRFALMPREEHIHFHANWAVFIDGQRLNLSGAEYMEDVARCAVDPTHQQAEDRAHMHEQNQDVVHVHASGVTWSLLLSNIGMGVGNNYLDAGGRLLQNGAAGEVKFILNGTQVYSIRNLPIQSEDRLLISYGPETAAEVIASQFPSVASTAGEFNSRPDPASCSGGESETTATRLKRAFLF